jgi:acetyl esterase/lipase
MIPAMEPGNNPLADSYAGDKPLDYPLVSPLYGDPAGLPPLLIHVGDHEVLLSDSTRFAEKAEAAGVDVQLEVWDEMIHVWHFMAGMVPEGQAAIDKLGEWIKQHVKTGATA